MVNESERYTSPEMRAAVRNGEIPAGKWRRGTRCHQQLHIDAPDGGTVDIGRVDSPELAAFIVDAVRRAHGN